MDQVEDPLLMAERQVQQFENAVASQALLTAELEKGGYSRATEWAREILSTLEAALVLARDHASAEREKRGMKL